jgi:predicted Zn-ribbon and HTH transcriptional regulator
MNLSKIYEGWRNNLVPPAYLKEVIDTTVTDRMNICRECEHYSENAKNRGYKTVRRDIHCTNCGCTLSAKSACLSCECPLQKWMAVLSYNDQQELEKKWKKTKEKT